MSEENQLVSTLIPPRLILIQISQIKECCQILKQTFEKIEQICAKGRGKLSRLDDDINFFVHVLQEFIGLKSLWKDCGTWAENLVSKSSEHSQPKPVVEGAKHKVKAAEKAEQKSEAREPEAQ
jgi:hypothetical protein